MAAKAGRAITITRAGVLLAGVQDASISINAEPIDITSDDDAGWRALLDTAVAQRSVDISCNGVSKDEIFVNDLINGTTHQDTTLFTWPNGAVLSGTFQIVSAEIGKPTKDGVSFSASFQSTGPVTFTAGV